MTVAAPRRPKPVTRSPGWVPVALIALVVVPADAGSLRVVELLGGPAALPANPRLNTSPVPVLVHIVSALSYAVLGAFQFSTALRRRRLGWHRAAGRVLVVLGLAVAASALWMTLFFPRQPGTGELTYLSRLAFASGLALCLVRGVTAVRRGDLPHHRAWMTRCLRPRAGRRRPALRGPARHRHRVPGLERRRKVHHYAHDRRPGRTYIRGGDRERRRLPVQPRADGRAGAAAGGQGRAHRPSARNHLLALARTNGICGRQVDEVIDLVDPRTVATTRVGGFSLGMGQRLGVASTLLGNPQTVALDEPANGLDPEGVLWMRTMLTSLAAAEHNDRRNLTPTLVAAAVCDGIGRRP